MCATEVRQNTNNRHFTFLFDKLMRKTKSGIRVKQSPEMGYTNCQPWWKASIKNDEAECWFESSSWNQTFDSIAKKSMDREQSRQMPAMACAWVQTPLLSSGAAEIYALQNQYRKH